MHVSPIETYKPYFFQGIIGADGRHYILDLFRSFPPDVNFLDGILNFYLLSYKSDEIANTNIIELLRLDQ